MMHMTLITPLVKLFILPSKCNDIANNSYLIAISSLGVCDMDKPVPVIGSGLVGCVQAIFLAKRGFKVELYESRQDIRKSSTGQGRSINLTLSYRGRAALSAIECEEELIPMCVPVYGRIIHSSNGTMTRHFYSIKRDAVALSIHRLKFNEYLLNKAEAHPNINVYFQHKFIHADLKEQILTFDYNGTEKKVDVAFTFGCDGAHSAVRRQLMQSGLFNYTQEYIDHGYKELTMPPTPEGDYPIPLNFFHVWPKHEFMLVALPNQDKSFTLTLFLPFKSFHSLKTEEDVLTFFKKHFPDPFNKIGADRLVKDFFTNPIASMISVKCSPHYLDSRTIILGDAAHAMVPFYGQGLNSALEDCLIFDELLEQVGGDLHKGAQAYSNLRWKNCHLIVDMSMSNYLVLRSHCTSRLYVLKKYIDDLLYLSFPYSFIPLYLMVVFSRMPYHKVIKKHQRQEAIIKCGIFIIAVVIISVIIYFILLFAY